MAILLQSLMANTPFLDHGLFILSDHNKLPILLPWQKQSRENKKKSMSILLHFAMVELYLQQEHQEVTSIGALGGSHQHEYQPLGLVQQEHQEAKKHGKLSMFQKHGKVAMTSLPCSKTSKVIDVQKHGNLACFKNTANLPWQT